MIFDLCIGKGIWEHLVISIYVDNHQQNSSRLSLHKGAINVDEWMSTYHEAFQTTMKDKKKNAKPCSHIPNTLQCFPDSCSTTPPKEKDWARTFSKTNVKCFISRLTSHNHVRSQCCPIHNENPWMYFCIQYHQIAPAKTIMIIVLPKKLIQSMCVHSKAYLTQG